MIVRVIMPVRIRTPSARPSSSRSPWVTISSLRRSKRSATQPVTPTSRSGGRELQRHRHAHRGGIVVGELGEDDPVLRAVACIHAPMFDTSAPMNQTR